MINFPEFQNMWTFVISSADYTKSSNKMTVYFLNKGVAVIASIFRLWMTQDFVQNKIYLKLKAWKSYNVVCPFFVFLYKEIGA